VLGGADWKWSAIPDAVPPHAWWLMLSNLFWVLAYDTEYAIVDRDDDVRIGIQTSALTLGRYDVAGVMLFYAVYLVSWALLGRLLGLGLWFMVGMLIAAAQTLWHYTLIRDRGRDGSFRAFRMNHWVGFAVYAGTAVDLALR
jgi:4-hydroxybenzoate polyprenyltransferase